MEIKIPIRIVSEANSNEHWSKKSKRHKLQHLIIKSYLNSYLDFSINLPVHLTLIRGAPRLFDGDNLQTAFKYVRDAIAAYLTGNNTPGQADSDPRITWNYKQEKTSNKEYYIKILVESHKQDLA